MEFRLKRRSILVFAAVIALTLVLTSCTGMQLGKKTGETSNVPLTHTGTKGIEMRFLQGYPPDRFYFDPETYGGRNSLSFEVEVRNSGISEATGTLYLGGFDPNIISITKEAALKTEELPPKSMSNPEGGVYIEPFIVNSLSLPTGTEIYAPKIVLTACYDYETTANPAICVDPDPYAPAAEKVCIPSTVANAGGQGAPVSVSNIVVEPVPGKLQLKMDITNVGGGVVVNEDSLGNCPYTLAYGDLNTVGVYVNAQGIPSMNCNPKTVRLTNNKATIYCSAPIAAESAYTTPLVIRLNYAYMNSITKQVEIRNIKS